MIPFVLGSMQQVLTLVEFVKLRIEQLVANQKAGLLNDAELNQWLDGLADRIHDKLARVELVAPRNARGSVGLQEFLAEEYTKDCPAALLADHR